jgi:hypothetical protein
VSESSERPTWHPEILPAGWLEAVRQLQSRRVLAGFYLAGGTGLALSFGHRRSVDLDLFAQAEFDSAGLRDALAGLPALTVNQTRPGTLHLELGGVLVSFLHYPDRLLFPVQSFEVVAVADPRDIACMKLDVIGSRGSRRDFVDLYVAARQYELKQIVSWFEEKYASVPYNRVHVLKSLTYFADAEREPMPDLLTPLDWSAIKRFFDTEAVRLL